MPNRFQKMCGCGFLRVEERQGTEVHTQVSVGRKDKVMRSLRVSARLCSILYFNTTYEIIHWLGVHFNMDICGYLIESLPVRGGQCDLSGYQRFSAGARRMRREERGREGGREKGGWNGD